MSCRRATGTARLAAHGKSWMLPGACGSNLLYTVGFTHHQSGYVRVYSYPQGDLAGEFYLDGYARGGWVCSDANGNVFFPALGGIGNTNPEEVLEYAHGGTTPIATLSDSKLRLVVSRRLSMTHLRNLAVANNASGGSGRTGNVAIFHKAQGTPTLYVNPHFTTYYYACGYATREIFLLMVRTSLRCKLPNGSSTFINMAEYLQTGCSGLLRSMGRQTHHNRAEPNISACHFRFKCKDSRQNPFASAAWNGIYWLEGSTVIMPMGKRAGKVGLWNYPAGGGAFKIINILDGGIDAETVSVAPSGSHIRQ